jgi:uncharacterized protein YkwD
MTFTRRLVTIVALCVVCASGTAPAVAATSHHKPSAKHKALKHKVTKHSAKKAGKQNVVRKLPQVPTVGASAAIGDATLSAYEARLLTDVNGARADAGLAAVRAAPGLTDVARRWALQLAHADALSHNPGLVRDLSSAGAESWRALAENVGMAGGSDADDVFAAYMASAPHKANILGAQSRWIGIGAVESADAGGAVTWNTLDFSDSYDGAYGSTRTTVVSGLQDDIGLSDLAAIWKTALS